MKNGFIKKADILLSAVLLIIGMGSMFLLRSDADENSVVAVTVDGQEYARYSLLKDRTERIETEYGYNLLTIEGGKAKITDADCKNRDCLSFGYISREGEIIVCLPHRLMVKIVSSETGGEAIDSVSY